MKNLNTKKFKIMVAIKSKLWTYRGLMLKVVYIYLIFFQYVLFFCFVFCLLWDYREKWATLTKSATFLQ